MESKQYPSDAPRLVLKYPIIPSGYCMTPRLGSEWLERWLMAPKDKDHCMPVVFLNKEGKPFATGRILEVMYVPIMYVPPHLLLLSQDPTARDLVSLLEAMEEHYPTKQVTPDCYVSLVFFVKD